MFKNIGKAFIDMATQMLAQQMVLGILKMFGTGLTGGFGGFSGAGPVSMPGGGGFASGFGMPSFFAEGGFVTGPTNALIGEGGEPEYVLPASRMESALARYSMGARGEAVLDDGPVAAATLDRYSIGNAEAASDPSRNSLQLDMKFQTTKFMDREWVDREQLESAMAETQQRAARQGAKMGMGLTMNTLRKAPSARRQIGI